MNQQLETNNSHWPQTRTGRHPRFTPLEYEDRSHVDTASAAYHLGRRPQTMRVWACLENGPLVQPEFTADWPGRCRTSGVY